MKNEDAIVPACARCQYREREPFIFGTVYLPRRAQIHEVEAALWEILDKCMPTRPDEMLPLPGSIRFVPRDND